MGATALIGLGILAWVLLAIPVALFVARMIRLRDRQRPDRAETGPPAQGISVDGAEATRRPSRWRLRNGI